MLNFNLDWAEEGAHAKIWKAVFWSTSRDRTSLVFVYVRRAPIWPVRPCATRVEGPEGCSSVRARMVSPSVGLTTYVVSHSASVPLSARLVEACMPRVTRLGGSVCVPASLLVA